MCGTLLCASGVCVPVCHHLLFPFCVGVGSLSNHLTTQHLAPPSHTHTLSLTHRRCVWFSVRWLATGRLSAGRVLPLCRALVAVGGCSRTCPCWLTCRVWTNPQQQTTGGECDVLPEGREGGRGAQLAQTVILVVAAALTSSPPHTHTHERHRYPALQWQLRAARRALAAVAAAGPWLRDRVSLTRYAHVPLGGLGRDALMSIADVLMSRRLREAGHVLWTADPALPDLGGFGLVVLVCCCFVFRLGEGEAGGVQECMGGAGRCALAAAFDLSAVVCIHTCFVLVHVGGGITTRPFKSPTDPRHLPPLSSFPHTPPPPPKKPHTPPHSHTLPLPRH